MRTPRTLAECRFSTGYPSAQIPRSDRILGRILAFFIGIFTALALAHWWAS